MVEKISQEMQQKVMEFQEVQQQARMVVTQKYQLDLQLKESQAALDELEKVDNAEIHKAVGQILIKTDKASVTSELKEKIDTLGVHLKSLESQEKKLTDKLKAIQDRLQGILPEAPQEESKE